MYRSHPKDQHPHNRTGLYRGLELAALTLLVTMVLLAAANLLVREPPAAITEEKPIINASLPVADNSPKVVNIGGGTTLDLSTGKITYPPVIIKAGRQTLDIGNGYTLELTGNGGRIIAPSRPSTDYQRIELGAGQVLEIHGDSADIHAPARLVIPTERIVQTIDLGAGHQLVLHPQSGRVVAPVNLVKTQVTKMDLGGGYWLETTATGTQIVREGSR